MATQVSVARASRLFIPVAPLLLDVLACTDLHSKKPTASTERPPRLEFTLRLAKSALTTSQCQDVLVDRTFELLEHFLETYRYSIGAPELIFPAVVALRAFTKKIRVTRWRTKARVVTPTLTLRRSE